MLPSRTKLNCFIDSSSQTIRFVQTCMDPSILAWISYNWQGPHNFWRTRMYTGGYGKKKIKKGKNIAVGAPYHSRYDIVKRISTYWLRWKLNMLNSYFSLQDVSIWQKKRWTITGKSFPCLRRLLLRIFHITDSVLQFIELPNNSESASNWISK